MNHDELRYRESEIPDEEKMMENLWLNDIYNFQNKLIFWRILTAGLGLTIVALLILWPK